MDWKKLHENIYEFAKNHGIRTEESDTTYVEGQLTTYQLIENFELFYELKHVKHIVSYGNKLRVYSNSSKQLSIEVKARLVGKPVVKSTIELTDKLHELLSKLANKIGTYNWTTGSHHAGWPTELKNSEVLKFECKQVDLAAEQLELIRKVHLNLLQT